MTTQTLTLTDFLLARIAQEEAEAHDCLNTHEAMLAHFDAVQLAYRRGWKAERASVVIDTWHPARVLAECEAKRRIVEAWPDPFGKWTAEQAEAARAVKERTLRELASVYADHPDFNPEWRVSVSILHGLAEAHEGKIVRRDDFLTDAD